jgi:hypothetical protein
MQQQDPRPLRRPSDRTGIAAILIATAVVLGLLTWPASDNRAGTAMGDDSTPTQRVPAR